MSAMDTVGWVLIGTLLLGALTFGWWRWRTGTGGLPTADVPAEDRA